MDSSTTAGQRKTPSPRHIGNTTTQATERGRRETGIGTGRRRETEIGRGRRRGRGTEIERGRGRRRETEIG
jgi:hypothetical protein